MRPAARSTGWRRPSRCSLGSPGGRDAGDAIRRASRRATRTPWPSAPTDSHLGAGLAWAAVATDAPRAAEFFAGIGLVRLALEQAGVEVAFANDVEPTKQALYAANFGA